MAGFDAPYRTSVVVFPDGRVVVRPRSADPEGRWPADRVRVIDRLGMQRIGAFGHSFGGATALQFCHDDGAPYGSVVKDGLTQPFLFLLSDHGDLSGPEPRTVFADIDSIYRRLPEGSRLAIIRGANHFSFSGQILLKSEYVVRPLQWLFRGVDGARGLTISRAYLHTFFDVWRRTLPQVSWTSLATPIRKFRSSLISAHWIGACQDGISPGSREISDW